MHMANMSKRPISSAKEFVKRGQEVWVKVLSTQTGPSTGTQPQRISMSMRDVDQATGGFTLKIFVVHSGSPVRCDAGLKVLSTQTGSSTGTQPQLIPCPCAMWNRPQMGFIFRGFSTL